MNRAKTIFWACALFLATLFFLAPAHAFQLITKEEAQLPSDPTLTRGITRGPKITLVWPAPNAGSLYSPVRIKILFEGRSGYKVRPESIIVTYAKLPPVDLTKRLTPYIRPDGIEVDDAIVPSGHHRIRVQVADTAGRTGFLDFSFEVRN